MKSLLIAISACLLSGATAAQVNDVPIEDMTVIWMSPQPPPDKKDVTGIWLSPQPPADKDTLIPPIGGTHGDPLAMAFTLARLRASLASKAPFGVSLHAPLGNQGSWLVGHGRPTILPADG